MEFVITYKTTPTAHNPVVRMVVEAESAFDACVVAADALTRRGCNVEIDSSAGAPVFLNREERLEFERRFPGGDWPRTLLATCLPYDPKPIGRVVSG